MSNEQPDSEVLSDQPDMVMAEHVRSSRGNDARRVMVDIAERDLEEGRVDIDLLFYLKGGVNVNRVEKALKTMARNLFGEFNPEHFTAGFRDPFEIAKRRDSEPVSVQAGDHEGVYRTFELIIHPPRSNMYTVEGLEERVLPELNKALNNVELG